MNHKIWRFEKFPSHAKINSFMLLRKSLEAPSRLSCSVRSLCRVRLADHVPPANLSWCRQFGKSARPTDGWDHLFCSTSLPVASGNKGLDPGAPSSPGLCVLLEFWSFTSQLGDWNPLLVLRPAAVGTAAPTPPLHSLCHDRLRLPGS